MLAWDSSRQRVRGMSDEERDQIHNQDQSGQQAWGKRGVAVGLARDLRCTLYTGHQFDKAVAVLVPRSDDMIPALWTFCTSPEFNRLVRQLDQKVIAANGTLSKVSFDMADWEPLAQENYPAGLPRPYSSDPTQWLFGGHPKKSDHQLQVAVARLVGYRWPRQTGSDFPDCPPLEADGLEPFGDKDGVVWGPNTIYHGFLQAQSPPASRSGFGRSSSLNTVASSMTAHLCGTSGMASRTAFTRWSTTTTSIARTWRS